MIPTLALAVFLCFPALLSAQCSAPYERVTSQCLTCPATDVFYWAEAIDECATIGGALAPIYDQDQQDFAAACIDGSTEVFTGIVFKTGGDLLSLNGTVINYEPATNNIGGGRSDSPCNVVASATEWKSVPCSTTPFRFICTTPITRCPKLEEPDSSSVTYDGDSVDIDDVMYYDVDTVATFECDDGFTAASGNTTRDCTSDGSWSGDPLVCSKGDEETTICGDPEDTDNGSVEVIAATVAVYSCDEGFTMTGGDSVHTCAANGIWVGVLPSCTATPAETQTEAEETGSNGVQTIALGTAAAVGVLMATVFGIIAACARSSMTTRLPRGPPPMPRRPPSMRMF